MDSSEERHEVFASFDLALRIGEVLLVSGAGAADVAATMDEVVRACGLRNTSADVTFVDLTLRHQPRADEPAALQIRRVTRRRVDYEDLIEVDATVNDLVAGTVTRDEAAARVARIVSTGHQRPRGAITLGWGVVGAGIGLTLGGSWLVCLLAFLGACAIDQTQRLLAPHRIPTFYIQAAGAFVATLIAVAAAATPAQLNPSRVITAAIVILLAGIGLMGATQDALNGFPLTASARFLNAMLDTTGIIAGVSAGLTTGDVLGIDLGSVKPGAAGLAAAGVTTVGAAIAASAYAYACYAPLRSMVPVAFVAAIGEGVALAVKHASVGETWSSAAAAVTIGALCYLVSRRFRLPPLVIVVPAVVPLLPGLAIYRALALLAAGKDGVPQLVAAIATALALAAGVILGQYLAQPLKREARRLETRLAGPRMVGPFRRPGGPRSSAIGDP